MVTWTTFLPKRVTFKLLVKESTHVVLQFRFPILNTNVTVYFSLRDEKKGLQNASKQKNVLTE